MKVIVPSVELMHTGLEHDFMSPEQFIERVGRTCYKSEDKITDTSAEKFVAGLVKRGHEAMIEHWALIFKTDNETYRNLFNTWAYLLTSTNIEEPDESLRPFLRFTDGCSPDGWRYIISGNMRAWRDFIKAYTTAFPYDAIPEYLHGMISTYPVFFPEFRDSIPTFCRNDILIPITVNDLVGKKEHNIHHDVTVKFTCDRGVSHEIVRHRTSSFAQESTRYCNYSGDKYGNEITVVRPSWCDIDSPEYVDWWGSCMECEADYFCLLEQGRTPQEARSVLPNSLKTEVIMTTNRQGWGHFFKLRCAKDAHPDIQEVANMLHDLFDMEFNGNTPDYAAGAEE